MYYVHFRNAPLKTGIKIGRYKLLNILRVEGMQIKSAIYRHLDYIILKITVFAAYCEAPFLADSNKITHIKKPSGMQK